MVSGARAEAERRRNRGRRGRSLWAASRPTPAPSHGRVSAERTVRTVIGQKPGHVAQRCLGPRPAGAAAAPTGVGVRPVGQAGAAKMLIFRRLPRLDVRHSQAVPAEPCGVPHRHATGVDPLVDSDGGQQILVVRPPPRSEARHPGQYRGQPAASRICLVLRAQADATACGGRRAPGSDPGPWQTSEQPGARSRR